MKIGIKKNSIFIEKNWQKHFKQDYITGYDEENNAIISPKIDLTKEPYNYDIIELEDIYALDCTYNDFDNNIFNLNKYNERKNKINKIDYNNLVIAKIRERYSLNDELSIQRQKEIKPKKWEEYNLYCEECKTIIKSIGNI